MASARRVYLDHAATTPIRPEVLLAMMPVLEFHFGNPSSFYQSGRDALQLLNDARARLARAINADPSEIFLTSGGSESDNWAIKGTALSLAKRGKHIISSAIEHHAVLHSLQALERQGYEVTWLGVDDAGRVDPEAVRTAIRPDTILVSIMTANNEIGTIQPVAEIAAICRGQKVLFHTDAVQAAGAIPLDVRSLGVDMMSFSGHKFYAPKGIGFLYLRKGVRIANLIDGGAQERGRRAGTENVALAVGMAKALELATAEMESEAVRLIALRDRFIDKVLDTIPHVRLNGDRDHRLPNNINISIEFIEGESILLMLDHLGYECSSGSACTSGSLDPSHVLLAIGLPHEIAHGSLRVTLGKTTEWADLENLATDLASVVIRLREMSPLWDAFLRGEAMPQTPDACIRRQTE